LALETNFSAVDQTLVKMHCGNDQVSGRKARLMKYCAIALQDLIHDPRLTVEERVLVDNTLRDRRRGALYHSLVEGDLRAAREFLAQVDPHDLGKSRYTLYQALTRLPPSFVRGLVRMRFSLSPRVNKSGDTSK